MICFEWDSCERICPKTVTDNPNRYRECDIVNTASKLVEKSLATLADCKFSPFEDVVTASGHGIDTCHGFGSFRSDALGKFADPGHGCGSAQP